MSYQQLVDKVEHELKISEYRQSCRFKKDPLDKKLCDIPTVYEEIHQKKLKEINGMRFKRIKLVSYFFMIWLIPLLVLYFIGSVLGWVICRFKHNFKN